MRDLTEEEEKHGIENPPDGVFLHSFSDGNVRCAIYFEQDMHIPYVFNRVTRKWDVMIVEEDLVLQGLCCFVGEVVKLLRRTAELALRDKQLLDVIASAGKRIK